jgi:hypothetical protein
MNIRLILSAVFVLLVVAIVTFNKIVPILAAGDERPAAFNERFEPFKDYGLTYPKEGTLPN